MSAKHGLGLCTTMPANDLEEVGIDLEGDQELLVPDRFGCGPLDDYPLETVALRRSLQRHYDLAIGINRDGKKAVEAILGDDPPSYPSDLVDSCHACESKILRSALASLLALAGATVLRRCPGQARSARRADAPLDISFAPRRVASVAARGTLAAPSARPSLEARCLTTPPLPRLMAHPQARTGAVKAGVSRRAKRGQP
jgi:hypothetical protein